MDETKARKNQHEEQEEFCMSCQKFTRHTYTQHTSICVECGVESCTGCDHPLDFCRCEEQNKAHDEAEEMQGQMERNILYGDEE